MPRLTIRFVAVVVTLVMGGAVVCQTVATDRTAPSFGLSVAVDEVVVSFHAGDKHGLPVRDLRLDELRLLDNDATQPKIVSLQLLEDAPIHVVLMMDTSVSMARNLADDRAIANQFAQAHFRHQTDRALVVEFGRTWNIAQPWTSAPEALAAGVRGVSAGRESRTAGTAIFDNLAHVCRTQFEANTNETASNVVLLFSDGEDNASYMSLPEVVDACQRANTSVYAFRAPSNSSSTGPKTLAELTQQTGGRVFKSDASESEIKDDLTIVESDLRQHYQLVYRPAALKHDGAFHRIAILGPDRVNSINVRSGYYAPTR